MSSPEAILHSPQSTVSDTINPAQDTRNDQTVSELEIYLAISYQDYKLGIALYKIDRDAIGLLHEVYEYYDFSYVKNIIYEVKPTDVIISSKCDAELVRFLKKFTRNTSEAEQSFDEENNNNDNNNNNNSLDDSPELNESLYYEDDLFDECLISSIQFKIHYVSNRLFQYDQCKTRILSFNIPQMANMSDSKERFIYLSSNINFSEINTINSFGVLLYFIEKNCPINFSSSGISKFDYFNYQHVTVDQTTFEALEIFQQEWHPSTSKKGFYKKEGLSVYGIFNLCSSKLGSFQLKKIFHQPTRRFEVLIERQEIIEYFTSSLNSNIKTNLAEHLKNIKDIIPILNRFKVFNFQFSDFESLFNIVASLIFIRNILISIDKPLKLSAKIVNVASIELEEINDILPVVIDFQKSKTNKCIEINKKFDDELDDLKMIFNKLPEILSKALSEESHDNEFFSLNLRNVSHVYIPQLGFLLSIPLIQAQSIPNIEQYGLEAIFCANDRIYYKNAKMKEYDTYYGDIKSDINDQIQQVLIRLKDFILDRIKVLKSSIFLCAQLDAFLAMAQAAVNYHYVRPKLTCTGAIKIEDSRHPLYELIENSFTPNSFSSDGDEGKITIIFGPNSCGKSVFLKQISLIVFLAHIGSFVPAGYAEITIMDKIFTRIRTPESISTQLSSFKHDLNQIIMATKYASQRSLVVIDFFGKGTLSTDGYALLTACINHWISSYKPPHVIISSLFHLAMCQSSKVRFFTFETLTGLKSFKLIPYENDDIAMDADNSQEFEIFMPELIRSRTEKLITESFSNDMKETFPEMNEKYNGYIELAELILEGESIEEIRNKVSRLTNNNNDNDKNGVNHSE